ncbi:hypothetical protein KVP09_09250 [Alcaligenaceae bacterium CGII-47]|nr:hypothetical protein [Alcaligenaceae bacterium CGII-47]
MFTTRSLVISIAIGYAALVSGTALAANKTVTVVNKTKSVITAIHASNTGTSDWEEDILGRDTLAPGESVDIDMTDGSGACRFDLKAEFEDGTDVVQENLDVCKVGEFTFTE